MEIILFPCSGQAGLRWWCAWGTVCKGVGGTLFLEMRWHPLYGIALVHWFIHCKEVGTVSLWMRQHVGFCRTVEAVTEPWWLILKKQAGTKTASLGPEPIDSFCVCGQSRWTISQPLWLWLVFPCKSISTSASNWIVRLMISSGGSLLCFLYKPKLQIYYVSASS